MQIVAKRYRISPGTYCHALTNILLSILMYVTIWCFPFFSVHVAIFYLFFANIIRPSPQSWISQIFSNFFYHTSHEHTQAQIF